MKTKIFAMMMLVMTAIASGSALSAQTSKPKKESKIRYHAGPVMLGTNHVYFIFYGNWAGQFAAQATITDFVVSLGNSPYLGINTTYTDSAGTPLTTSLLWGSNINDAYSHGINLTQTDIASIVSSWILSEQVPLDPQGIYFVLASDDVNMAGHCTDFCEFHHFTTVAGIEIRYAFVGNPRRCPSKCAAQLTGPSGDYASDAMINWIAHDIAGVLTNPNKTGWFDREGKENSDKCLNKFGPLYQTPNGALANVNLGGRDYLLQMNWVNDGNGYCALSYP
jgi:hypothetical protein